MGMARISEAEIQSQILKTLGSDPSIRLFRNHVGRVQDSKGRWHSFGLAVGSADLIGFQTVEITPEMVGTKLAVFVSIECKSATGAVRPEQEAWARTVRNKGGRAVIARSIEEAKKALSK